jgi:hypothetical protein
MLFVEGMRLGDEIEKRAVVDFLQLGERLFHCAEG